MHHYKETIKHLMHSMKDDIKDAYMLLRYAKDEKINENIDLHSWYINKAKARMDMVKETKDKLDMFMKKAMQDHSGKMEASSTDKCDFLKCYMEHLEEESEEVMQKLNRMR